MNWEVVFTQEAEKDFAALDGSQKILVKKAIQKVKKNPLPNSEGGYGKPLNNYSNSKLAGLLKIKLKNAGIRIIYKLLKIDEKLIIIVIGARADDEVYKIAENRVNKK